MDLLDYGPLKLREVPIKLGHGPAKYAPTK